jgi:hypothetical protein
VAEEKKVEAAVDFDQSVAAEMGSTPILSLGGDGGGGRGGGGDPGKAVHVETMKPVLKAHGTEHLKLKYDEPVSNFAFRFNLRRYPSVGPAPGGRVRRSCQSCGRRRRRQRPRNQP